MVKHEESVPTFMPKGKLNFIIMGTMVAINARIIDGVKPSEETFFYNNNRNHFWRVLQYLMNKELKNGEAKISLTIEEKKDFLKKNKIGIINLVDSVVVPNKYRHDPSDTVLFEAYKKDRITYKTLDANTIKRLIKTPIFFTCREKTGIRNLLDGFIKHNKLPEDLKQNIWFWATPTRCNPFRRSLDWRREMHQNFEFN